MSYKGVFKSLAEASKGGKAISYVPSSDGKVYRISNEEFGILSTPITSKVSILDDIKPFFIPKLPKIPSILFEEIIGLFKHYAKKNLEVMVLIYWDRIFKEYVVFVPEQEISTSMISTEIPIVDETRYLLYMDIHSHHNMKAKFSSIDDKDEKATMLYTVIGNLDKEKYSISVRASNGGTFLNLDPHELIEITYKAGNYPAEWEKDIKIKNQHIYNIKRLFVELLYK